MPPVNVCAAPSIPCADACRAAGATMPTATALLDTVSASDTACTAPTASIARPVGMNPYSIM